MAHCDVKAQPVHLVVAVHGLWGDPGNLNFLCDTLIQKHDGVRAPTPDPTANPSPGSSKAHPPSPVRHVPSVPPDTSKKPRLVVLNTTVNRWVNTYDGVDWCAERVIREIDAEINRIHTWASPDQDADESSKAVQGSNTKPVFNNSEANPESNPTLVKGVRHTVTHFSIVGYSLGGLIARYIVGALYIRGFFRCAKNPASLRGARPVVPVNLVTIATPHIGIPPTNDLLGSTLASVGKVALGRTGRQLYCSDHEWYLPDSNGGSTPASAAPTSGAQVTSETTPLLADDTLENDKRSSRPLLEAMADPQTAFFKALSLFRTKVFYGSAKYDLTVPFRTALVELDDPFVDNIKETVRMTFVDGYPHLIDEYAVLPRNQNQSPVSPEGDLGHDTRTWARVYTEAQATSALAASRSLSFATALWKPLMFFRPSRFPFKFPLNYVASLLAPIAFPILLGYMLVQTSSYTRASVDRITEERRAWALTYGLSAIGLVPESESSSNPENGAEALDPLDVLDKVDEEQLERNRIAQMLFGMGLVLEDEWDGEESSAARTSSPSAAVPTGDDNDHAASTFSTRRVDWTGEAGHVLSRPRERTPVVPLTDAQQRMVKHLNSLPGLQKRIAYFGGEVINAHSVIIVRRPHLPTNQLGIDVIRHFACTFQV